MEIGQSFSDLPKNSTTYIISKAEQKSAYDSLPPAQKSSLDSIHARVKTFASAQRAAITNIEIPIPGGFAGHKVTACKTAGCYAPGGRYPLPSSVVMTCATARAAGCDVVVLSTPNPQLITKAAGYVAGCDVFVAVGGAQAIAAMAYGVKGNGGEMEDIPPCDVICGPGNKWVTAAKSLVNGHCGIDMLAGPSEVLVICDDTADVKVVASDLIAQAEHDVVARPILVSDNEDVVNGIIAECKVQLSTLPSPNRETATTAFGTGFAVICGDIEECVRVSDSIAPEHLEIQTLDHQAVADSCRCYGGLFIGTRAAEVLGDYGAGPNHTLPTGGTGRYTGGLSVFRLVRGGWEVLY